MDIIPPAFIVFLLTCLIIEMTPGPNMAWLALLRIGAGPRAAFAAVGGVAAGLLAVGLAAVMGMTAVMAAFPGLYEFLRLAGTAYLLWMAWDAWRMDITDAPQTSLAARTELVYFRRGVTINLLNPKAALFYVSILPGFISPHGAHAMAQNIFLTLSYVTIATLVHCAVVIGAGLYTPAPQHRHIVQRFFACALCLVAIWFFYVTHPD